MSISPRTLTVPFRGVVAGRVGDASALPVIRLKDPIDGAARQTIPVNPGWCGFKDGDAVRGIVDINTATGATEIAALHFDR